MIRALCQVRPVEARAWRPARVTAAGETVKTWLQERCVATAGPWIEVWVDSLDDQCPGLVRTFVDP